MSAPGSQAAAAAAPAAAAAAAAPATGNPTATLATSIGLLKAEIFEDAVPMTAANFIDLTQKDFYSGLRFHSVVPGYAMMGGCPYSGRGQSDSLVGTGAPAPDSQFMERNTRKIHTRDHRGYIEDEFGAQCEQLSNTYLTMSMSNCGPGTAGSQFFINLADNPFLDWWSPDSPDKHIVFGKIVSQFPKDVKTLGQV